MKVFGRPPANQVTVDFTYDPDPQTMAKQLEEFTSKQCTMMDFKTETRLIETLMKGVMDRSSQEYKLFRRNLD